MDKIGEGGMGEVYRALDTSLDRPVAIKVLPKAFAEDKERLARFEREAKLLAVLNHPAIAAIHGIEGSEGRRFLVLELVEGQALGDRLGRGPLPIEEAFETCKQLAEGLEAAHEKGIVHRDLKPGNIMITPEGRLKILDFGLAKAYAGETTNIEIEKSPTITARMTEPGVILGTAAYMSPEQARGRAADKRSDIWAFGGVLYECLTGKRAFQGETVSDTLALVLKGEPDWNALPANTPTNIRTLLHRCLQKNPKNRLHDIADARLEIDEAGSPQAEESPTPRRFPLSWVVAVGAVLFIAGILIRPLIWKAHESVAPAFPVASVIKLAPGYALDGMRSPLEFNWPRRTAMAISGDGRFIVYCAVEDAVPDAKPRLFMRRLDELEASPIAGTEGGIAPFLSPDDRWVGFWADGKLKKAPIAGGMAQDICEATSCNGASWGAHDRIVFVDNRDLGLSVVAASGGKPEVFAMPSKEGKKWDHSLPSWLPDARGILFTVTLQGSDSGPRVALYDNTTQEWKDLLEEASNARFLPTGHLAFLRRGVLMAVPFSSSDLKIAGEAVPIRSDVMQFKRSSLATTVDGQLSISPSGSLIYASGGLIPDWNNSLAWVDREGNDEPASSSLRHHFLPRLSPDGQKIVYQTLDSPSKIWICDIRRDISFAFLPEGSGRTPLWTPDGERIIFNGNIPGLPRSIFSRSVDGSTPMETLFEIPPGRAIVLGSVSPDQERLVFTESMGDQADILIIDLQSKSITPFRNTRYAEDSPSFSPDGRWIVYCSDKEGRSEVYVSPSSGSGGDIKISRQGGAEPAWARSGEHIFFRSSDRREMWVVDVQTGTELTPGNPRLLFQSDKYGAATGGNCWDTSPDDRRFLMVKREVPPLKPVTEMILVQNWFEEVRRLALAGKK
ncbi:MAG: protein kinase [Candidatus Aminicenantes bacterium]|nr:protein kinase [Candidatus Aminicenantes bacterium]